jgi:uncharacterized protein
MPRPASLALAGLGAIAAGAAAWGALVEKNRFQLRHEVVPILDAGSDPITVLHLSDLHIAPWNSQAVSWISELAHTRPDLVIGTGDFLGHPDALPALTRALEPLAGIPGVVTHGSNDRLAPRFKNPFAYLLGPSSPDDHAGVPMDFDGLVDLYTSQLGWRDIDNSATHMTINGSVLELVGLGDAHYGLDQVDSLPSMLDQLREGADDSGTGGSHTTLGVTHAPYRRVLDAFVTNGAEAIFAGHTHGGQVCLPGGHALTTNCDLPNDQASGLSQWRHAGRSSYLNVSAGLGTSIYAPVRLFCPPEAVLVSLVGEDIGYA